MKRRFTENSVKLLNKVYKEGLLSKFVQSIKKSIEGKTDAEIDRILRKTNKKGKDFAKLAKKDQKKALNMILKDMGQPKTDWI